ncbi:MAG: 3-deoxy-D-manno-octulosonic acid transferase [Bacteroidetes bacterium]|nr:3-deoxy-D-manno-octulosonic acid transferase [Bacteroidota bacterium]
MWKFFYNYIGLSIFWIVVQLFGLFKEKIKNGIDGRNNLFQRLEESVQKLDPSFPRLWIHASSMGEFEQAKPIIFSIKKYFPNYKIIVTLFSPSAYEHSLHYPHADIIEYLPFDTEVNAKKFISIVNPKFGIIIRYDVWPNIVWEAKKNNVPLFLVNATLNSKSGRLWKFFLPLHKLIYDSFDSIMTVSGEDKKNFEKYNLNCKIEVVGDTRYEQVFYRAEDAKQKQILPEKVFNGKKIFILAQTWKEDEKITLPPFFRLLEEVDDLILLIVPHEPTLIKIEELKDKLSWLTHLKYTTLSEILTYQNEKIIIVDSVGVLTTLYKYVFAAYVGGSFKQGVHNVLEPAVFGLPLFYGPRHTNSQEAIALSKIGASKIINSSDELYYQLTLILSNQAELKNRGNLSLNFVKDNAGATEQIIKNIQSQIIKS